MTPEDIFSNWLNKLVTGQERELTNKAKTQDIAEWWAEQDPQYLKRESKQN